MKRSALSAPLLVFSGLLCIVGCKNKDEPETTPPTAQQTQESGPAEEEEDPNKAKVNIDPKVAELCGLSADQTNFDYDSAKLSKGAKQVLDKIADCFLTGPGKDHNLNMVGHADPRGTEEYNFALGQKRAGSVASYLDRKGLGNQRVATSSRGELDATGSDEAGWASDRSVDILLADRGS
jgi:peptidoglycan-associated lipoprotein